MIPEGIPAHITVLTSTLFKFGLLTKALMVGSILAVPGLIKLGSPCLHGDVIETT